MDSLPPSPNNHIIVQANPQIAAALSVNSPMQQGPPPQNHQNPNEQQFVSPPQMGGMGVRVINFLVDVFFLFIVRGMPYPPPQMRGQGPPQHFSPMGMQQQQQPQQQFNQNGQPIQMAQRPIPPPNQGGQIPLGMAPGPGPSSHPMGMVGGPPQHGMQQGAGQPQFMPNSPMPPQIMSMQQQQQPAPQQIQSQGPPPIQQQAPPPPQPVQQVQQQAPQQQQQPNLMPASVPCGAIMDKSKLDDLMQQISSTTVLEESVKDVLVDYADDFVSALIDKACKMIKNREIKKIESRDIEFILKNIYNMPVVPRAATHIFGTQNEAIDLSKEKHIPTEAHKQRVALLKKQLKKI
ncbi:CRE-TAF-12 protein [Caenorhabditis remanei]|uniref:Transcription initiation factor TFIID subunit 12 n=1 Tax=Caenorhabditis remanei TaxID=31234 RepID=E3MI50_CAERE|nr:CRE-TAF-12 protein [Caenorhabditis remanei]